MSVLCLVSFCRRIRLCSTLTMCRHLFCVLCCLSPSWNHDERCVVSAAFTSHTYCNTSQFHYNIRIESSLLSRLLSIQSVPHTTSNTQQEEMNDSDPRHRLERGGAPPPTREWFENNNSPFTGFKQADIFQGFELSVPQYLEVEAFLKARLLKDNAF